ncbi:ABC transporter ATP-binding protein [Novosphingobium sp. 1949]|uniref:ABC transporter ATP-binding protein n=1 Tax=Novosphingobium organovorum TaxID=2930092 RepID=A0ABT0BGN0_9SPHN|nr:ABC transporter ATP-binding protein [Novosphingobium organovorum]MCJ2184189.1 ABC transporter ATP-binding protein [Novosphingobium organovorum]
MIVCRNVSKSYKMGHGEKKVLRNVDLVVNRGERVALLGRNGAGKSTLIKLIGGVEMPTSGRIERHMRISWPLGLTGGFQGSLTGFDNARFIARIYERDYNDLKAFVEDFTELGRQLKMPVKTYSSGMRARLAFALSLAIEFECYLIDEVIMVGDQNFQQKCHHELFEKRKDRTMVLATHSSGIAHRFCDRALILQDGHLKAYENLDVALETYAKL